MNMYEATPEDTKEKGMNWYANVHDAAIKSAREAGKTTRQAAGVVAAVSPNMDWEKNNINAFHEIDEIRPEHWDAISSSAREGRRDPAVRQLLKGMSISTATDSALLKAHRIWHGNEDPEAVLTRGTAPKTNSFFRNINEPHHSGPVTVDGRHADLVVDAMRPWSGEGSARGIQSADLKRGKTSRYEQYEEHTRRVADRVGILPHQFQAVVWEGAKPVERGFDPKRKKGDPRRGQSYQSRLREFTGGSL
jgi:hypothetical protein